MKSERTAQRLLLHKKEGASWTANVRALTFYLRIAEGFMALSQPKHKSYQNLPGLSSTKVRPYSTVDFGFKASSLPTQNFLKLETGQP